MRWQKTMERGRFMSAKKMFDFVYKNYTKITDFLSVSRRNKMWKRKFEKNVGKQRILVADQKEEIRNFYKEYTKIDMVFPEFYTQKTGEFFKNYIPDNLHYCKIDPFFNDWRAAAYLDNKCYYEKWYFKGVNTPKTVALCINGIWSIKNKNESKFISEEEACELISKYECFLKKATSSLAGQGVRKTTKGTSVHEIKKIVDSLGKDIVVQEAVIQSAEMSKLNPHSVNTIRVLSFLDKDGCVKIYSAIVRMGINHSYVDNASSGGITCGIEPDGRLKPVAYATNGTKYDCHPTTGLKFSEVVIPNYDKVISLVKELQKDFPHFRLLSWDIAIDENDEPLLIEVNLAYGELDFHQLNNGPLFGEDTQKILDEVFGKK